MQAPDWVNGGRALRRVSNFVHAQGLAPFSQALLADTHGNANTRILLAGYNVFDSDQTTNAHEWCLPRASGSADFLVGLYEEYVDRPLGTVPAPDRVMRAAWGEGSADALIGSEYRRAEHWWLPLAWLMLAIARSRGVPVEVCGTGLKVCDPTYRFEVDFDGCYSNTTGRTRKYATQAQDANLDSLSVPLMVTAHPLAVGLSKLVGESELPLGIQWALNSAIRCEQAGKIPSLGVRALPPPRARKKRNMAARLTQSELIASVSFCREILVDPPEASLRALARAAVPSLLSQLDFTALVGAVWDDRDLTEAQIERFAHFLELKEKNLLCRHVSIL